MGFRTTALLYIFGILLFIVKNHVTDVTGLCQDITIQGDKIHWDCTQIENFAQIIQCHFRFKQDDKFYGDVPQKFVKAMDSTNSCIMQLPINTLDPGRYIFINAEMTPSLESDKIVIISSVEDSDDLSSSIVACAILSVIVSVLIVGLVILVCKGSKRGHFGFRNNQDAPRPVKKNYTNDEIEMDFQAPKINIETDFNPSSSFTGDVNHNPNRDEDQKKDKHTRPTEDQKVDVSTKASFSTSTLTETRTQKQKARRSSNYDVPPLRLGLTQNDGLYSSAVNLGSAFTNKAGPSGINIDQKEDSSSIYCNSLQPEAYHVRNKSATLTHSQNYLNVSTEDLYRKRMSQ